MLEKFKEQIFQIIANDTGSNIKPTQDQINAINGATTLDDAKAVALQAGWGTYVSIFEERNPTEETPTNIFSDSDFPQFGYQSNPFIGVNKDTPITIQELFKLHSLEDLIEIAEKKNNNMSGRVYWKTLKFIE